MFKNIKYLNSELKHKTEEISRERTLKSEIFDRIAEYYNKFHKPIYEKKFIPGKSCIPYARRGYDEKEMINLVDSSLEFWLTYGLYSRQLEERLADYIGVKYALLVNSGSSANLLAFMALTSPLLEDKRIKRGDEIITVAAGFPTTIAPIIQYGAIPVFTDIRLESANVDVTQLENAISSKTRAVILAHTLGNPFDIMDVKDFCSKHNLWLVEDNCDALGSQYLNESCWPSSSNSKLNDLNTQILNQKTGSFGDIGTSSFYPPHHMTMGEGGAVYTSNKLLKKIILSMRDWGRDCWCESGMDNTCSMRFSQQHGTLPYGFDHKYVYSHFGYNFKPTDMQAAIGCAQIEKMEDFTKKRKENFQIYYKGLKDMESTFILPQKTPYSDPNWFGFILTLRDDMPFSRNDIVSFLEKRKIQTRNLFAGNIIKQPCFESLNEGQDYRICGDLKNTDKMMHSSFWLGVYPGMHPEAIEYVIKSIREFVKNHAD